MENKYSFAKFIMECCKAREWNLRSYLSSLLSKNGFTIIEDDFISYREGEFSKVHNMLAVRGKNPKICLVAHTDVCRDHVSPEDPPDVNPIIKTERIDGEIKSIIQDKYCDVQVGGDDRLGVAINTWIALNTGYDMGLLFTTDEEIGVVSAEYVRFPELLNFDLLLQVDRGNHSNQLVTRIGGVDLCSEETGNLLIKISDEIGLPRYKVNGMLTDVLAIKTNYMCKDAVNMTCGYHNSIGAQHDEYIDIQEAKDTMKYVASIIKHYDLASVIKPSQTINNIVDSLEECQTSYVKLSRKEKRRQRKLERKNLFSEEMYNKEKRF